MAANGRSSSVGSVLVVDDEPANLAVMVALLARDGYDVHTAVSGNAALAAMETWSPDVILLDVRMPGMDGFEVCRRIKQNQATRLTPVVMVTGLHDRENKIAGINAGADDFLAKPFDREELRARVRSLFRLKRYTDDLESAEDVIMRLALTVEARDAYTEGHCQRLAHYSVVFGESLQLSDTEIEALYRGGYLHDVGKIGVPDAVLQKPTRLTDDEFMLMKEHTVIGERLCGNLRSLRDVRAIIRHHHERLDGKGYPDALAGDQVPLLAQIVSIADAYDAITTTRPYRAALPPGYAHEELRMDAANGMRDPELVEKFIAIDESGAFAEPVANGRRRGAPPE